MTGSPQTIFLDRDGVINRQRPGDYVRCWEDFEFLPGAKEALALLSRAGLRLVVVTNQRGVARGMMTWATLEEIRRRMIAELAQTGASIAGVYACTHDLGQCSCRKPQTGLFLQALAAFPGLRFDDAVLVGDSLCDLDAGSRIGSRSYLIADDERASAVLGEATRRGIPVSGTAPTLDALVRHCLLPGAVQSRA